MRHVQRFCPFLLGDNRDSGLPFNAVLVFTQFGSFDRLVAPADSNTTGGRIDKK